LLIQPLDHVGIALQALQRLLQLRFECLVLLSRCLKVILELLLVNVELSYLSLLLRHFRRLPLYFIVLLLDDDVFIADVGLSLLLQGHHLFLVCVLLLL